MKQYNPSIEKKGNLIKLAIDMHLKSFRVVRQMDHASVQPGQRFEPARFCIAVDGLGIVARAGLPHQEALTLLRATAVATSIPIVL
jgi:hypothetical protein